MPLRINNDFKFGTNLNDSGIVNALMITAAEQTRKVTLYKSETEYENYTISQTANGATSLKAESGSDTRMFIIKGTKATSITVDGSTISSKTSNPTSENCGFAVSGSDTYVYLPQGEWNEVVIAE